MWKTSQGIWMGWVCCGRPSQWHSASTHFMPSMQTMPSLFSALTRFVQRQIAKCDGKRIETSLEIAQRITYQHQSIWKIVKWLLAILNAITVVLTGLLKKRQIFKKSSRIECRRKLNQIYSQLNSWARQATADVCQQVSNVCVLTKKCVSTDFPTPFLIEIKTTVLYNDYQSYLK